MLLELTFFYENQNKNYITGGCWEEVSRKNESEVQESTDIKAESRVEQPQIAPSHEHEKIIRVCIDITC